MRVTGYPKDLLSFVSKLMPMNTNDPQAPYTVKLNGPIEAATAPMLSDEKLTGRDHGPEPDKYVNDGKDWLNWWGKMNDTPNMDAWEVRSFYEAKIASGELMVVRTARLLEGLVCSNCGACWFADSVPEIGDHCYCGAKIVEG